VSVSVTSINDPGIKRAGIMIWTMDGNPNQAADFWRDWRLNVIPADTKNKKPLVSWHEWLHKPIPEELHNAWKEQRAYSKGFAIVTGRSWHLDGSKGYINFDINKRYPESKKPKLYYCDNFGGIIATDLDKEGDDILNSTDEDDSTIVPWSNSYLLRD
jgi:hypothetical protein